MIQAQQAAAFSAKTSRRVLVAQMALSAALLFSGVATADNCKAITGTVSPLQPVVPCASPYGCFQGTFSGDLSGSFQSVLTSVTTVPTSTTSATLVFNGLSAIETPALNGTLYTSDKGSSLCALVDGQLGGCFESTETLTITSGLGAYKSGSIVLMGGYLAGQTGTYAGEICHGKSGKGKG